MAWTKQQQDAIDARDTSLIVSAAAGSGKTAVLTERLVQILSDKERNIPADRIVVVTFTTDAAAELKKRLDGKLRTMITESGGDPFLLRQQNLLQNAKISTINSFCFDLLRDNISDQGITSGFGVLSEEDDKVIKAQAMDALFDWFTGEDYATISALYDCFCIKSHENLVKVIREMDKFLSSTAIRDKWLRDTAAEYKKPFKESVYCDDLFSLFHKNASRALKLAEENLDMLKQIFPDMTTKIAKEQAETAHVDVIIAETLLRRAERREFPTADERDLVMNFPKLKGVQKTVDHNMVLREIFKERHGIVKKLLTTAVKSLETAQSDFEESGKVFELLAKVMTKYNELVWEIKRSKNAISFDDGERLALELLAETDENGNIVQSETALRISELYDLIMIDEYQDSNNKEDLIFKLISRNYKQDADGTPMYGDNAFVVGDIKQSIYGFRLANPRNFRDVLKSSEPYESGSECKNQSILLNKNFRSSPEVIDFVNFIFTQIMTTECGDIDYNKDEMLYFGAEQYTAPSPDSRKTHITFIGDDPQLTADEVIAPEEFTKLEVESVAYRIRKMIDDQYKVREADGSERPCTPGDFCILVRSNKETKPYEAALERLGIAARGSDEKGYLKSREITILIDLLRIIANPLQDIPMAAVLTSPMYMFTIEEIAILRSCGGRYTSLYSLVIGAAKESLKGVSVQLSARCKAFLESLDKFRLDSITMTIGELINSIYDTTDFISVMQLYKDGEKKRANLRALIQHAQNYESYAAADGTGGLSGFLRHIDNISENGDYDQGSTASVSGDYVTISTNHRSKGLEYPFVFIAETSHMFKFDSKKEVMCSDNNRIGFILYDKKLARKYRTFQHMVLNEQADANVRSEEMRLFYVALTRAKQKLFVDLQCGKKALGAVEKLVSQCRINDDEISELVTEANSISDWLWLCLMMHGSFQSLAAQIGITGEQFGLPNGQITDDLFECEICNDLPGAFTKKSAETKCEADEKLVEELRSIIESSYDRTLSETTAKVSVTQLTHKLREEQEFDFRLKRPRFVSETGKLTGAERGTAIHTFFQYCDFSRAIADVESEIKRMEELGYLTKAQGECIVPEKITAFFGSGLYQRLSTAKRYEREKKFTVAAADLEIADPAFDKLRGSEGMIKGIIDLMFEEEDGIVIVDYKSDTGISEEKLREQYTRQLEVYKSALELTEGKPVKELYLYSIELRKEIKLT